MPITFVALNETDTDEVVDFLVSNSFPFHVQPAAQEQEARAKVSAGRFWNDDTQGYWINDDARRVGMVALEDLQDEDSPVFDLRLAEDQRGNGLGLKSFARCVT